MQTFTRASFSFWSSSVDHRVLCDGSSAEDIVSLPVDIDTVSEKIMDEDNYGV
jgi:hypothetical protein